MSPRSRINLVAIGVISSALALSVISYQLSDSSISFGEVDEQNYHLPAIRQFAEGSLVQNLGDYPSTTFPTYHLLMAWLLNISGGSVVFLRLANAAISAFAAYLFFRLVYKKYGVPASSAAALLLAFVLNPTYRGAAAYLMTDTLPIAFLLLSLWFLHSDPQDGSSVDMDASRAQVGIRAGAAFIAGVAAFYSRQFYAWVPVYVFATLVLRHRTMRWRVSLSLGAAVSLIPGIYLFWLWGGVTQPKYQFFQGAPINLSSIVYAVSFVPVLLFPLLIVRINEFRRLDRVEHGDVLRKAIHWASAIAALAVVGGIVAWRLGEALPSLSGGLLLKLGERVPEPVGVLLVWLAAAIGVAMIVDWVRRDGAQNLWWILVLASFGPSVVLFQRYFEPVVLVVAFLIAAPSAADRVYRSQLIWLFPAFEFAYSVGRLIVH